LDQYSQIKFGWLYDAVSILWAREKSIYKKAI
jgi:hypothetical protein